MKKAAILLIFGILSVQFLCAQKNAKPLILAHNFESQANLWDALGKGIFNYQADVMYIYGKIYATPLMPDSANHKFPTLTDAYLYPLYNQFKKNNGEIIPGYSGDIYLILNMPTQPIQVYKQLVVEMRPFMDMLSYTLEGKKHPGKLRILIKDKLQLDAINNIKPSFLGLIGRQSDIGKTADPEQMPLIEVDFNEITSWKGTGNIPFEDFIKFKDLVAKVHAGNQKVSFVNCPSYKPVAELIQTIKADFMNTPEAIKMAAFFETAK